MTPQEFKAWFDGFTECMDGQPTAKQWKRIKKRVAEIDGRAVTERVYVDRYYPRIRWDYLPGTTIYYGANALGTAGGGIGYGSCSGKQEAQASMPFNSSAAMLTLGRSEYEETSRAAA